MHKEDIYILQTKQYYKILATLLDNCSTTCKIMNFDTMKVSIVTKNSVNTLIDGMYKKQKSTSAIGRFIKQQLLSVQQCNSLEEKLYDVLFLASAPHFQRVGWFS